MRVVLITHMYFNYLIEENETDEFSKANTTFHAVTIPRVYFIKLQLL